MRIYEYARKHEMDSKAVVHALQEAGVIDKPNAALSVDEEVISQVLQGAPVEEPVEEEVEEQVEEPVTMRVHQFAKRYGLDTSTVLRVLKEAGIANNAGQNVEAAAALQAAREAGLFTLKRHARVRGSKVRDLKAGIEFFIGEDQQVVYSRAAEHYSAATGEERDSVKVRNLAYKVVLRAFQDGLIIPTTHRGNKFGRGAWDPEAKNREEYVAATGT
jgi:phage antirepressor YoqD-like protein